MKNVKEEVRKIFEDMSDEEFFDLLLDSGFEVDKNGTGQVIYFGDTKEYVVMSGHIKATFDTSEQRNKKQSRTIDSYPIAC